METHPIERQSQEGKHIPTPPLFPPRRVPSFAEVVGPKAAQEYQIARADLDQQELDRRRRSRISKRLGKSGLR